MYIGPRLTATAFTKRTPMIEAGSTERMRIRMRTRTTTIAVLAILVLRSAGMAAHAQGYPTRPVRIVEPFGVGGGPDLLARALAPKLSKLWGQPVTVENIPGAGATAGPALVAKPPAGGCSLPFRTNSQVYWASAFR